ncbi:hypothetical protein QUF54_09585 [Candidatus Marithioploca araucensis]|uniref:Uncharacterized protein n=1 Tax=Candidatus Marithioploca araucensis TaxID=70273 RepID=A0ABT7VVI6_9GAMM|nr:hypothetical protein [Candidatus Marithioploca araucensis]
MALRRLALFKKSALATRDYSSPPIGFPDSQRLNGFWVQFDLSLLISNPCRYYWGLKKLDHQV